jgi:type I restriction enzyme S subunit
MNLTKNNNDWRDKALLDLVTIKSGQVDPRDAAYRDLPLIAPDHLAPKTGRLIKKETAATQGAISGKYLVRPGDVIYSKIRPYLQKAYKCDFVALCSADMYPLTPRPGVDSSFILHSVLAHDFTNFAVSVSARSGIPKINREELAEYRMLVPGSAEQRAIGHALDDSDQVIAALEKIIAKKQAIKQGMLQELLTGRTRLPGFTGIWNEVSLGKSGTVSGGGVDKISRPNESKVLLLNYMDVYRTEFIDKKTATQIVTAPPIKISNCSVRMGDVFFTPTSETPEDIARSAVANSDLHNVVYSYHLVRWRPGPGWDSSYLAYVFSTESFRIQASTLASGSGTRYVISMPGFRSMKVLQPPIDEQRAIGNALKDVSAEIEILKRRLVKARAIKTGMTQQLLSGRVHLPMGTAS